MFHLLSAADLNTLKRANAHFSDDLLSSLLNEPIEGQGIFWSSVGGKPYPVSLRVTSFEQQFPMRDPDYNRPAGKTVAQAIRDAVVPPGAAQPASPDTAFEPVVDAKQTMESLAIAAARANTNMMTKLTSEDGIAWYGFQLVLRDGLPEIDNRDQFAFKPGTASAFGNIRWCPRCGLGSLYKPAHREALGQAQKVSACLSLTTN